MAQRIKTNAPKPYTVLTVVQSESGSWEYEIRTSHQDGKTYCTCKGFGFHKHCKHMDAFKANPQIAVPAATLNARPRQKTPADVLMEELAMLGLKIGIASATAITTRVLSAGGKVSAAGGSASSSDELNTANVRVIILPD